MDGWMLLEVMCLLSETPVMLPDPDAGLAVTVKILGECKLSIFSLFL